MSQEHLARKAGPLLGAQQRLDAIRHADLISLNAFESLRKLMQQASGIVLADHKKHLVATRLATRLRTLGLADYDAYVRHLRQHPEERQVCIDLLTTNETRFFREPRHFEWLERLVRNTQPRGFRVWSAACSSGEEPYTIAMVLAHTRSQMDWEVLGTDLSRRVLDRARAGVYLESDAEGIPREWLVRFCLKGVGERSGHFQIKPQLRKVVKFQPMNLNETLPADLGLFDVVFLRNVLIYFDRDAKERIVRRILEHIPQGGYLLIGHSESLHGYNLPLKTLMPSVYQKL
ncbi:protein-glutamate O-methyltransferase CheR [Marinobacteraceae bacterium S3BR75-40.1]